MNRKGFLDLSFQWIFAIIVGIFILFLTIYGITKLIGTETSTSDLMSSKELGSLLNPLETSFEGALSTYIEFPVDTRLYSECNDFGDFGRQGIKISQKSFGKWSEQPFDVNFYNKYLFAEYPIEGKRMILFSKPFEFPFKVANLIYILPSGKTYCFKDSPENIKQEIENLKMPNVITDSCLDSHIKVCFGEGECEIKVNYNQGYVEKKTGKVYFQEDALMYAGIFSDTRVYECQLKRLMKRTASLAQLYIDKANFVSISGCNTNINPDLQLIASLSQSLDKSNDLYAISLKADDIQKLNNNAMCKLW